jgi:glycosyltransferase involved in cell wall biosynthesis
MAKTPFLFTIFIPTYNRAHTLPRALKSVDGQSFRDFEVLLIDDGSTDETKALIVEWQDRVGFPIVYHWQPNQGKHAAHNAALEHARGELTVILDSDDMLAPDALEKLRNHWQSIPEEERRSYAGVEGLCAHMGDGRIAGTRFPEDVMDSDYIEIRKKLGITGDKKNAVRTDLLRRYPFPRFEGERHIRPSLLWKRLSQEYRFRYVNEVIQLVEYQQEGLSANRFHLRMANPRGFSYYFREEVNVHGRRDGFRRRLRNCSRYVRYSLHAGNGLGKQMKEIDDTVLWVLSLPKGITGWMLDRIRLRTKGSSQR